MSCKDYHYNLTITNDDSEVSATVSPNHRWIALVIVLMAPFVAILDVYIVFAYPSIQHGLRASSDQIQFVIAG